MCQQMLGVPHHIVGRTNRDQSARGDKLTDLVGFLIERDRPDNVEPALLPAEMDQAQH